MIFRETKAKAKTVKKKDPVLKEQSENYRYVIGIDCGVNTGFACWDKKKRKLIEVSTYKIHEALTKVKQCHDFNVDIKVRVEDARKKTLFGTSGKEQLQGAGSIKRDAKIWEDFLTDNEIPFEMVAPKNNKAKINADYFKKITGWTCRTNEHSRDAAFLVFGM